MTTHSHKAHQKHAKLAQPKGGSFARHEVAIMGTSCNLIQQLAFAIIQQASLYKLGFADADHKSEKAVGHSVSAIGSGACAAFTDKISFARFDAAREPNAFERKILFNDCDAVLVNGNHFTAAQQILVIDEAKPLDKKLDRITDVQCIILKDAATAIPSYLITHLPHITSLPCFVWSDAGAIITHVEEWLKKQVPAVNGLVLAGGKSTRMGADKGRLVYHGKAQREHLFQLLQPRCAEVFLSCHEEPVTADGGSLPFIPDSFLQLGPYGGILSAMQTNPNRAWLTIACDLPFLDGATLDYLLAHRNASKMATAFIDADNRFPEPLITIWEPRAYLRLLQFLAQGYSCPRKVLINSDVELLQAPDASTFKNVNTTEEYNEAVKALQNKHNYC